MLHRPSVPSGTASGVNAARPPTRHCTLQAILSEWDRILGSGAYLLVLAHPAKFLAAGLAGFGVNGLAIIVIKLASSLTLKVGQGPGSRPAWHPAWPSSKPGSAL